MRLPDETVPTLESVPTTPSGPATFVSCLALCALREGRLRLEDRSSRLTGAVDLGPDHRIELRIDSGRDAGRLLERLLPSRGPTTDGFDYPVPLSVEAEPAPFDDRYIDLLIDAIDDSDGDAARELDRLEGERTMRVSVRNGRLRLISPSGRDLACVATYGLDVDVEGGRSVRLAGRFTLEGLTTLGLTVHFPDDGTATAFRAALAEATPADLRRS